MTSPITLDALKVLDAIDRKKSFASAAEELFRVPSAISYTVHKLEEDLNVSLFDRTKRKAELTPVGKMLVEQGRLILQATEELTHAAKQSASGWELELRICLDSIIFFQPIYTLIAEFQRYYPWINIRVSEEVFGGTWDAINADRCDLIIGGTVDQQSREFSAVNIGTADFVFAIAKDHPLSKVGQPITKDMIKMYPSISVADSSRLLPKRSARLLNGQSRLIVPSIDKKIEAHLLGLGIGYLPTHRIKEELSSGQLIILELAEPEERKQDICIAWRKNNKGKALHWFINKIKELEPSFI